MISQLTSADRKDLISIEELISVLNWLKEKGHHEYVMSVRSHHWLTGFENREPGRSERGVVSTCSEGGLIYEVDIARVLKKFDPNLTEEEDARRENHFARIAKEIEESRHETEEEYWNRIGGDCE